MRPARFPAQFYQLIPALYPHLADILTDAGLSFQEFACLSMIKHHGKPVWPETPALPLAEMKEMLVRTGGYTHRSANGYLTQRLQHQKQFLECRKISKEQKAQHFPKSTGYRDVLILAPNGVQKLEAFNSSVERLFDAATRGVPALVRRGFLVALVPFTDAVLNRLAVLSEERERRS